MRTTLFLLFIAITLQGCKNDPADRESTELSYYRAAQSNLRSGNYADAVTQLQLLESRRSWKLSMHTIEVRSPKQHDPLPIVLSDCIPSILTWIMPTILKAWRPSMRIGVFSRRCCQRIQPSAILELLEIRLMISHCCYRNFPTASMHPMLRKK